MPKLRFLHLLLALIIINIGFTACSKKTENLLLPQSITLKPTSNSGKIPSEGYFSIKTLNDFYSSVDSLKNDGFSFKGYIFNQQNDSISLTMEFFYGNFLKNYEFYPSYSDGRIKDYYKNNGDSVLSIERPTINARKALIVLYNYGKNTTTTLDLYMFNTSINGNCYINAYKADNNNYLSLTVAEQDLFKKMFKTFQFVQ